MSEYRFIEDLHNVHKGEEIWVLGSGPSLDDFPDNFFDEKHRIAIAEAWSMIAFPDCTYTAFSQGCKKLLDYVLENRRHLLHKHIVRITYALLEKGIFIGPEPIYLRLSSRIDLIRDHDIDIRKEYFSSLAKNLIDGTPISYASSGTTIHTEIQAAIVMGAKKVTLAGCEAKLLKFQAHARKRGMDKVYDRKPPENGYSDTLIAGNSISQKRVKAGTAFLAKIMKPYGIQIARYYYDKGYELIV